MHQYELMVIIDPEVDERTVAPSLEKFLAVITKGSSSIHRGAAHRGGASTHRVTR